MMRMACGKSAGFGAGNARELWRAVCPRGYTGTTRRITRTALSARVLDLYKEHKAPHQRRQGAA